MARGILHNSDYDSVEAAKDAIDRYYAERNEYFQAHPKRAGHKIWGQERVQSEFHESNNCTDPLYCCGLLRPAVSVVLSCLHFHSAIVEIDTPASPHVHARHASCSVAQL